jgi:hypothetical protein
MNVRQSLFGPKTTITASTTAATTLGKDMDDMDRDRLGTENTEKGTAKEGLRAQSYTLRRLSAGRLASSPPDVDVVQGYNKQINNANNADNADKNNSGVAQSESDYGMTAGSELSPNLNPILSPSDQDSSSSSRNGSISIASKLFSPLEDDDKPDEVDRTGTGTNNGDGDGEKKEKEKDEEAHAKAAAAGFFEKMDSFTSKIESSPSNSNSNANFNANAHQHNQHNQISPQSIQSRLPVTVEYRGGSNSNSSSMGSFGHFSHSHSHSGQGSPIGSPIGSPTNTHTRSGSVGSVGYDELDPHLLHPDWEAVYR